MTKIDIFSGFLGAGKTTLIKKLIGEVYAGEKLVLIENEFGEIGIDGGFLQDAGIKITEMNSGCICCSLVGDFGKALLKVLSDYAPDRILIEPSGVGKLSDVIRAVQRVDSHELQITGLVTVVDAAKCRMHMKNFGEFFNDQIENAGTIILSHTAGLPAEKLEACVAALREHNPGAVIVTADWSELSGAQLLAAMERTDSLAAEMEKLAAEVKEHHHHEDDDDDDDCCHHHHDDEDDDHCCHHHHGEDEEGHEHHHHHHDDDDDEDDCCHHHDDEDEEHEHHHHHHHHDDDDDEDDCCCHHHDDEDEEHEHHHHHHHHHADEVFVSLGAETTHTFGKEELKAALSKLTDSEKYGMVLRAKGIVENKDGSWIHFDYVPGEPDVRSGCAGLTGRLCVIGSGLKADALSALFGVELN